MPQSKGKLGRRRMACGEFSARPGEPLCSPLPPSPIPWSNSAAWRRDSASFPALVWRLSSCDPARRERAGKQHEPTPPLRALVTLHEDRGILRLPGYAAQSIQRLAPRLYWMPGEAAALLEKDWVSSPGELHPEALVEPCLSVSAHTAPIMEPRRTPSCQCAHSFGSRLEMRATQCVALRRCPRNTALPHSSAPPIAGWLIEFGSITQPLRSIPFRGLHHYYELFRPWSPLPYSRPRGSSTCGFSVRIGVPGSHVPLDRPRQAEATSMPDAASVRKQAPPKLVPR